MRDFYVTLTFVSLLLLALGMVYTRTRRSLITEPMAAMIIGIVVGPYVLNLLNVDNWGGFDQTLQIASALAISMALMAGAYRLPKNYLKKNYAMQSKLLLLGMLGMWLCSSLIIKLLLPFSWSYSFLIGAIITPTDPVIAATIASGKIAKELLPERIRDALTFESCANDGLAFPLVMLPLMFIQQKEHPVKEWFVSSFLWETCAAILFGAVIGYISALLFKRARSAKSMAKPSMLVFSTALGFFVFGLLELLDCNGIIGVFAAGFVAHHLFDEDINKEQSVEQEARERLFIIPIFFVFGLILPWNEWLKMGWITIVVAVLILVFRRLPVVLLLQRWMKNTFTVPDALFIGWFGPIGAAAMFYAVYTFRKIHILDVWTIVSMIIFASTIMHGITGYSLSKKYHGKYMRQPEPKRSKEDNQTREPELQDQLMREVESKIG